MKNVCVVYDSKITTTTFTWIIKLTFCVLLMIGMVISVSGQEHPENIIVEGAKSAITAELRTDKVTYQSLDTMVLLTGRIENSFLEEKKVVIEIEIALPLESRQLAFYRLPLTIKPQSTEIISHNFRINVPEMTGLLAKMCVFDEKSMDLIISAVRPFDMTDDIRRNWRWSDTTWAGFSKILKAPTTGQLRGSIELITPEQAVEARYKAFANCTRFMPHSKRGHYTPWEEFGSQWTYGARDIKDKDKSLGIISLERLEKIAELSKNYGMCLQCWIDPWGFHNSDIALTENHPWVNPDAPRSYYGETFFMNVNPHFVHILSLEEEKEMGVNTHGAKNWGDYLVKEWTILIEKFGVNAFWLDNTSQPLKKKKWKNIPSMEGTSYEEYMAKLLTNLRKEADCPELIIMQNQGLTLGSTTLVPELIDIRWIEHNPKKTMAEEKALMYDYLDSLNKNKITDQVLYWSFGHTEWYDGAKSEKYTPFLQRQMLFEAVSTDASIVGMIPIPRFAFDQIYVKYPKIFEGLSRDWGFLTLYNQLFNSKTLETIDSKSIVSAEDYANCFDVNVEPNSIHFEVNYDSQKERLLIHVFNYVGTTTAPFNKRPEPKLLDNLNLRINAELFKGTDNLKACWITPDSSDYWNSNKINLKKKTKKSIEVAISLSTYTLVVVEGVKF